MVKDGTGIVVVTTYTPPAAFEDKRVVVKAGQLMTV